MIFDSYQLLPSGPVNLKFLNNGVSHREARMPGANLSDLPSDAQSAINTHWTSDLISSYNASLPVKPATTAANAKVKIDQQAENERLKYITPGAGQAGVYLQKASEAKAALAEQSPSSNDYPLLAASIGIDGANITEVATTVQTIANTWTAVAAHIENVRLTAKKAIDDGSDPDTVLSNLDWSLP